MINFKNFPFFQADHLFHAQMGTEEATIDVMTRHVQRVNSIYKDVGEWPNYDISIDLIA